MCHTVNEGKVTSESWRLDLAKQMGPGVHETCVGAACIAVALLLLYKLKLARWKVAQASPSHAFIQNDY